MLPQSWYDLSITPPSDPRDLIDNAKLNSTAGVFLHSTTFAKPPVSWAASPLSIPSAPTCSSLWTDNQLAVASATQWNFLHGTKSTNPKISPLLSNLLYLKSGSSWKMTIPLSTGLATLTDIQLSYRDNAATSGDYIGSSTGGIPAISFTGSFTGSLTLELTMKHEARVQLAIRTIDSLGNYAMFGVECIIVK